MEETFVLVIAVCLASFVVVPLLGSRIANAADGRQRAVHLAALVLWIVLVVALFRAAG